jgi:Domain of unknown function (DUF4375)
MIPATPSLEAARKAIFARFEAVGEDPARLNQIDQTVVAVYGAQGVIDNGGLQFFFENDWPGTPPYSFFVDAYRRIGALTVAELLERAVRRFPFAEPHKQQQLRREFMASLAAEDDFFGEAACGDPVVWQRLEEYVRDSAQQP